MNFKRFEGTNTQEKVIGENYEGFSNKEIAAIANKKLLQLDKTEKKLEKDKGYEAFKLLCQQFIIDGEFDLGKWMNVDQEGIWDKKLRGTRDPITQKTIFGPDTEEQLDLTKIKKLKFFTRFCREWQKKNNKEIIFDGLSENYNDSKDKKLIYAFISAGILTEALLDNSKEGLEWFKAKKGLYIKSLDLDGISSKTYKDVYKDKIFERLGGENNSLESLQIDGSLLDMKELNNLLKPFKHIKTLELINLPSVTGNISDLQIPDSIETLRLENIPNINGDTSDLHFSKNLVHLYINKVNIHGKLSNLSLPTNLEYFWIERMPNVSGKLSDIKFPKNIKEVYFWYMQNISKEWKSNYFFLNFLKSLKRGKEKNFSILLEEEGENYGEEENANYLVLLSNLSETETRSRFYHPPQTQTTALTSAFTSTSSFGEKEKILGEGLQGLSLSDRNIHNIKGSGHIPLVTHTQTTLDLDSEILQQPAESINILQSVTELPKNSSYLGITIDKLLLETNAAIPVPDGYAIDTFVVKNITENDTQPLESINITKDEIGKYTLSTSSLENFRGSTIFFTLKKDKKTDSPRLEDQFLPGYIGGDKQYSPAMISYDERDQIPQYEGLNAKVSQSFKKILEVPLNKKGFTYEQALVIIKDPKISLLEKQEVIKQIASIFRQQRIYSTDRTDINDSYTQKNALRTQPKYLLGLLSSIDRQPPFASIDGIPKLVGDCDVANGAFVLWMRSLGIPARQVSGIAHGGGAHGRCQVRIPKSKSNNEKILSGIDGERITIDVTPAMSSYDPRVIMVPDTNPNKDEKIQYFVNTYDPTQLHPEQAQDLLDRYIINKNNQETLHKKETLAKQILKTTRANLLKEKNINITVNGVSPTTDQLMIANSKLFDAIIGLFLHNEILPYTQSKTSYFTGKKNTDQRQQMANGMMIDYQLASKILESILENCTQGKEGSHQLNIHQIDGRYMLDVPNTLPNLQGTIHKEGNILTTATQQTDNLDNDMFNMQRSNNLAQGLLKVRQDRQYTINALKSIAH